MHPPNPNGANQWMLDPRQIACWGFYIDPMSETFSNGTQSAIKAGYEPDYADQITTQDWFKGRVRKMNMLGKAERNLDRMLDTDWETAKDGGMHAEVMRIVADVSKTVATRIGKDDGWADRQELTGKGGKDLPTPIFGNYVQHDDGHAEGGCDA